MCMFLKLTSICVKSLMELLKLTDFQSLLSIDVEFAYVQPINADSNKLVLSRESQLLLTNATVIKAYEKMTLTVRVVAVSGCL